MNKREYNADIYKGNSVIKESTNGSLNRVYPFGVYSPATWAKVYRLAPIIQSAFDVYDSYLKIEEELFRGEEFSDSIRVEIKFMNKQKDMKSGKILISRNPVDFVEIGKKILEVSNEFGGPRIWRFVGLNINAI
jgi:hypothetical protein